MDDRWTFRREELQPDLDPGDRLAQVVHQADC